MGDDKGMKYDRALAALNPSLRFSITRDLVKAKRPIGRPRRQPGDRSTRRNPARAESRSVRHLISIPKMNTRFAINRTAPRFLVQVVRMTLRSTLHDAV